MRQGLVVGAAPHPEADTVAINDDGTAAAEDGQITTLSTKHLNTLDPVSEETAELTAKHSEATPWPKSPRVVRQV